MTVLLFLTMIIIFLGVDFFIQRKKTILPGTYRAQHAPFPLRMPSGIFFAPSHTWLNLFPSGNVRIGVDDFVLRMMENPQIVLLKKSGTHTKKGEPLFQMKEDSRTLTVRSPIEGEIVELNDSVQDHPEVMKEMLFSDGWAYTVKPSQLSELTRLFLGEGTRVWIQQELGRLRDFIAGTSQNRSLVPALLQDGGIPVEGALKSFTDEQCEQFEQQFLLID
jgi:glycine cleavage system H protein